MSEANQTVERNWYVIHTHSGYENKVRANLLKRIDSMGMKDKIFSVLVPMEDEVEYRNGKKRVTQKKIFPGYVIVEMIMSDDSWYVVRNTSGVTGFVGSGSKPIALQDKEIKHILRQMGIDIPRPKETFSKGEKVKVIYGPFSGHIGLIQEVIPERERLKLLLSIFGRETPVELEFTQVEKI